MNTSVRHLMDLVEGMWASKTLAAAQELKLFPLLAGRDGVDAAELAALLSIDHRPADMLLTACASLGLLDKREGRYVNSPLADRFLIPGKPFYFGSFIEMIDGRDYPGWMRIVEALRKNGPTVYDADVQETPFDPSDTAMVASFWHGMHSFSCVAAAELAGTIDFSGVRRVLDVGGGGAAYDIELCRAYPGLSATVFDLPFVCDLTRAQVAKDGYADRIRFVAGDFLSEDELPGGHDMIILSMIMHDWPEDQNRRLLRKCHDALEPGGKVLIRELIVDDERTGPRSAALMSMVMLMETFGRNYTEGEYRAWLDEAGFRDVHVVALDAPSANGVVIGYKR
jgi:SAM-dependent methyltransferase